MGKKNGALFSKALFGYRCKDVIEYIRTTDAEHTDEISRLVSERDALQEKLNKSEECVQKSEEQLIKERSSSQDRIKKISSEYDKKIAELTSLMILQKDKLADSENRASSYLKLVDSSSLRAENAEAELAISNAAIDDYKSEIADLKSKLSEKEVELKRASEFDVLAKKILESNSPKKQSTLNSVFSLFKKSRHHR
jgi:chromosome segregation ATPase